MSLHKGVNLCSSCLNSPKRLSLSLRDQILPARDLDMLYPTISVQLALQVKFSQVGNVLLLKFSARKTNHRTA